MRNLLVSGLAVGGVLLGLASSADAQNRVQRPGQQVQSVQGGNAALLRGQQRVIDRQSGGSFPKLKRSFVPLGLMNEQWSKVCDAKRSIRHLQYKPDEELRVRARHMDGVVLRFPEDVVAIVKGQAEVVELNSWSGGEEPSRIWVLRAVNAGALTSLQFIGGKVVGGERIYAIRVQTESVNTKSCPDLVVNIRVAGEGIKNRARGLLESLQKEEVGDVQDGPAALNVSGVDRVALTPLDPVKQDGESGDGTGRQATDWLASVPFDPAKISHEWKVWGLSEASLRIAPDVVYSDGAFMYLKYNEDRLKRIARPTVSRIRTVNRGGEDIDTESQIRATWRDNVLVVKGMGPIALDVEGLVVCITPIDSVGRPPASKQLVGS